MTFNVVKKFDISRSLLTDAMSEKRILPTGLILTLLWSCLLFLLTATLASIYVIFSSVFLSFVYSAFFWLSLKSHDRRRGAFYLIIDNTLIAMFFASATWLLLNLLFYSDSSVIVLTLYQGAVLSVFIHVFLSLSLRSIPTVEISHAFSASVTPIIILSGLYYFLA